MVTKVRYIDNGVVNADQITITTALPGDNSVSPATTAFVRQEISGLVDSSPGTLDTLNELAAALGDDPNFATTTATAIGLKAPIASPTFTGTVTLSGTSSIKVPVGTTAQRDGIPTNGMFRYNSSEAQFEGYQDGEWGAIGGGGGGGGSNTFTTDTFTGDGTTSAYALSQVISSENNLMVFIAGVFQQQSAYTLATALGVTTLTFSTAPASTREIIIYSIAGAVSGTNLNIDSMVGDGTTVVMTLSITPVNENNTQVFIDGVYQNKSTYSTSGTTLTFSTAPPNGTAVEVMTMNQTKINVPVDGTVTSAKLDTNIAIAGTLGVTGAATFSSNVGIGSSTANHFSTAGTTNVLGVKSTNGGLISIAATGTNFSGIDLGTDSIRRGGIYSLNGSNLGFYTNATNSGTELAERMRIDSAGALLLHPNNATRGLTITTTQTVAVGDTTTYNTIGAGYGRHVFQTDSVERMRIDSAGNVGIGTNSPSGKLHVKASTDKNIYLTDAVGETSNAITFQSTNDAGSALTPMGFRASAFTFATGNVGIGVTPSAWAVSSNALQVGVYAGLSRNDALGAGDLSYNAYLTTSVSDSWSRIVANASTRIHQRDGSIQFKYGASGAAGGAITWSESMRIDASGNVGIGTAAPAQKLHVNGSGHMFTLENTSTASDQYAQQLLKSGTALNYFWGANQNSTAWGGASSLNIQSSSGAIAFFTSGSTLRMRIHETSGNIDIPNGDMTFASGHGIDFSATPNSGTPGTTHTSSLLDDYEEGYWTPVFIGTTGQLINTQQLGSYTKIGNLIHLTWYAGVSALGTAAGDLQISNLPYAALGGGTSNTRITTGSVMVDNLTLRAGLTMIVPYMSHGATTIQFYQSGTNTGWNTTPVDASFTMIGGISYRTV